ncbi:MAG: hypothetical protein J7518_10635 [Nocardioidaceae bacterium]|nr:hypothetical protein [Nocardioidaceae bacterium]
MSRNDASARPSQVTVAGWTVAVASAVVVLAVWQTMSRLHSLDLRDELDRFLTTGSGKGLGLDVDDMVEVVRWSLYVTGVAAVASAILGVYVLRRDKAARIGVTVAAVPIVLTSPVAGSLPGLVVGAGAAMLWTAPARDWFAGRPVRATAPRRQQRPPEPPRHSDPAAPRPDLSAPPASQPAPTRAFGRVSGADFPPPQHPPVHPMLAPPPPATWALPASVRTEAAAIPARVRIACWTTWVFTAVTGVAALASIVVLLLHQDALVDEVTSSEAWKASMDESLIVPTAVGLAVVMALWCAVAAVLAVFAWRRQTWAWVLLLVSTGFAALFSMFAMPRSVAHLVATALCLGLLLNREIRAWYRATPPAGPPPAGRVPPR